jgi:hypothetical protein
MTERHAWTIVTGCRLATTAAADERAGFAIPQAAYADEALRARRIRLA